MPLSVAQLEKYRSRFAWVFAISSVVLLISSLFVWESGWPLGATLPSPNPALSPPRPRPRPTLSPPRPHPSPGSLPFPRTAPGPPQINLAVLISVATLLTSVASLVGFFFTTGIAWRKERREQQQADLDLEMRRLEVEKLRLEVERKKQDSSHPRMGVRTMLPNKRIEPGPFKQEIRQTIARRAAQAFAQARFGFSTQLATSSGRSISTKADRKM